MPGPKFHSRRSILRLGLLSGGGLALTGLLQACSGSAPSGGQGGTLVATPTQAPAATAPPNPQPPAHLVLSQGATVAVSSPVWMAEAINAFADHGLSVSLGIIASTASTPALLANQTDALVTSAGPALVADLNGGLDEVYICAYANGNTASLYAEPSIHTATELKGKVVATDRPGTPADYYTRVALSLAGLQPSDVSLLPLGAADVALQALVSGQVQAAAFPPPYSFQAEARGFFDLQDTFDTPYLANGVVALRRRLDELGLSLGGLVAAIQDGVHAFYAQPELAMQTISRKTGEDDPAILKKTYDFFNTRVRFDPTLVPRPESLKGMLEFLASTTIPEASNATPNQFIETRFVDQLPK